MDNFNEIIKSSTPTLVDFFATWCGPCRMQAPILEQVKEKIGDAGKILKIDIDLNRDLAQRYHVQSVPTLIMFKNGEQVWRATGVQRPTVLESKFQDFK
ncbi:MAG: thioredoxin [Muribaculaceae bacterium]|nr:thioredoxin [Muribaculaceae bacterium]